MVAVACSGLRFWTENRNRKNCQEELRKIFFGFSEMLRSARGPYESAVLVNGTT